MSKKIKKPEEMTAKELVDYIEEMQRLHDRRIKEEIIREKIETERKEIEDLLRPERVEITEISDREIRGQLRLETFNEYKDRILEDMKDHTKGEWDIFIFTLKGRNVLIYGSKEDIADYKETMLDLETEEGKLRADIPRGFIGNMDDIWEWEMDFIDYDEADEIESWGDT